MLQQPRSVSPGHLFAWLVLLIATLLGGAGTARSEADDGRGSGWVPDEGRELLGTPAPAWRDVEWIQGGPLALGDLRGKVVLLRFWLAGCPYCKATAPALRTLQEESAARGLVVVGLHHPKSEAARDPALVRDAARALRLEMPIGLDQNWTTIRAYGVGSVFRSFTSVSFLIDGEGIIRWVHDGGEFHPGGGGEHAACNAAYESLRREIERLLASATRLP